MNDRNSQDLEQLIDRELKRLPDVVAPETLVHRVMLSVHARERRPWWRRAWPDWPARAQVVFLVVLAVVSLGAVTWATGRLTAPDLGAMATKVRIWAESWGVLWGTLEALANAGALLVKSAGVSVLWIGATMILSAYLLSVGVFTMGYRLAVQRTR